MIWKARPSSAAQRIDGLNRLAVPSCHNGAADGCRTNSARACLSRVHRTQTVGVECDLLFTSLSRGLKVNGLAADQPGCPRCIADDAHNVQLTSDDFSVGAHRLSGEQREGPGLKAIADENRQCRRHRRRGASAGLDASCRRP